MPARRSFCLAAVLAGLVLLIALAAIGVRRFHVPDLESADRVTLFSIDGRDEDQRGPGTGETLHGYPVLGKVVVTDPAEKQRLAAAVREGIAAEGVMEARCFLPRHVVRAEHGDQVTDYVICFHCQNYVLHTGSRFDSPRTKPISNHVRPTIEKPLLDANIPIAPD
jgi:hypothetical protein